MFWTLFKFVFKAAQCFKAEAFQLFRLWATLKESDRKREFHAEEAETLEQTKAGLVHVKDRRAGFSVHVSTGHKTKTRICQSCFFTVLLCA